MIAHQLACERAGDEAVAARPRWRHCARSASPPATEPEAVVGEGAGGGGGALNCKRWLANAKRTGSASGAEQALKDGVTSTGRRAASTHGRSAPRNLAAAAAVPVLEVRLVSLKKKKKIFSFC